MLYRSRWSIFQKTLQNRVYLKGQGLHSGKPVELTIEPAGPGTGIHFKRIDRPSASPLLAHALNITSTDLCTTIGRGDRQVSTIEHLMAAFYGLGIHNALVKLDADEVPIMDGSAAPFVDAFHASGIKTQKAKVRSLRVKKPFMVEDGDRWIRIEPYHRLSFECSIAYGNAIIGNQVARFEPYHQDFDHMSQARTFCLAQDIEWMRQNGLAKGGSLANAVVVADDGIVNNEGLRMQREFAYHKLLDCMGDLALLGAPLIGKVISHKSGHGLHAVFMKEILQNMNQYLEFVSTDASVNSMTDLPQVAIAGL